MTLKRVLCGGARDRDPDDRATRYDDLPPFWNWGFTTALIERHTPEYRSDVINVIWRQVDWERRQMVHASLREGLDAAFPDIDFDSEAEFPNMGDDRWSYP